MIDAAAFDALAAGYDRAFTATLLGRLLRERVWQLLGEQIRPGQRVLELACGTGEDALWMARHGVEVLATDGAAGMLQVARQKAEQAGLGGMIQFDQRALQQLSDGLPGGYGRLDGVFSDFGGLNTIGDWRPLAGALAESVRPGGWVLLVVMGPLCPWEMGWHLLHGQPRQAFRRLQEPAQARVGGQTIPVWYPSPRRLEGAFAPWFHRRRTASLGLWLPPTYLGHLVARRPRLLATLDRLERATAALAPGWGDHYMLLLEKRR